MKAMSLETLGGPLVLREVEKPNAGRGQVRVKVKACAVCRTDLHVLDGELSHPKLPLIPGHEIVGIIDEGETHSFAGGLPEFDSSRSTAGRLHTKHNLMEELKKVHHTLGRRDPTSPHEVLLVVDATTGANALQQAREFHKAIPLTGLIVTKLDGSGKGGVIVAIQQELGVPARYIGLGEGAEDFAAFDPKQFVEELL